MHAVPVMHRQQADATAMCSSSVLETLVGWSWLGTGLPPAQGWLCNKEALCPGTGLTCPAEAKVLRDDGHLQVCLVHATQRA